MLRNFDQITRTEVSNLLMGGRREDEPLPSSAQSTGWISCGLQAHWTRCVHVPVHYFHKQEAGPSGGSNGSVCYRKECLSTVIINYGC